MFLYTEEKIEAIRSTIYAVDEAIDCYKELGAEDYSGAIDCLQGMIYDLKAELEPLEEKSAADYHALQDEIWHDHMREI